MKNKLLVSVFAVAIAAFAFTSCEPKSDVTAVCTDMLKETLHGVKSGTSAARGLAELDGQQLYLAELEFASKDVNDPRLLFREIAFGDGSYMAKKVDTMTYEYGEWLENGTAFSLYVTPRSGETFVLKYKGDALIAPNGVTYGGSTAANTARVEKWESVISTFPNTDWEGTFRGEFVLDSVKRDSIKVTFIPPMTFKYDTIQVFDHMDTVSADTTCLYKLNFVRDLNTLANTGHYYRKEIRTKYDKKTKETTVISEKEYEYDFRWTFTEVSSEKKFSIQLANTTTPGIEGSKLNISKYELDEAGVAASFLLGGVDYTRPVQP